MPNRTPAACPYFVREKRLEICCEGMAAGMDTGLCFCREADRKEWFSAYCSGFQYLHCPYAHMIGGKYEREEPF